MSTTTYVLDSETQAHGRATYAQVHVAESVLGKLIAFRLPSPACLLVSPEPSYDDPGTRLWQCAIVVGCLTCATSPSAAGFCNSSAHVAHLSSTRLQCDPQRGLP